MELNYLRNILSDLTNRFSQSNLPSKGFLKRELMHLGDYEKALIKKRIISLNYDVGTSEVLVLLKETNIMNVSEYLNNIEDPVELFQIITDLFDDAVNCLILIEEILNDKKCIINFEEYLQNYVHDILSNQDLIKNEMISTLKDNLSKQTFSENVIPKFIDLLLQHSHEKSQNLIEVLSNQSSFKEKFKSYKLLTAILTKLMDDYEEYICSKMIISLKDDVNCNWFFVLMIISFVKVDGEAYRKLKKFIESQFKKFRTTNDSSCLFRSFIIARQLFYYSSRNSTETYRAWVKSNISELNYTVKDKEQFITIIESLQNIVCYEKDYNILEIHKKTQIAAPSKEYSRVLEYKRLLESRQAALM